MLPSAAPVGAASSSAAAPPAAATPEPEASPSAAVASGAAPSPPAAAAPCSAPPAQPEPSSSSSAAAVEAAVPTMRPEAPQIAAPAPASIPASDPVPRAAAHEVRLDEPASSSSSVAAAGASSPGVPGSISGHLSPADAAAEAARCLEALRSLPSAFDSDCAAAASTVLAALDSLITHPHDARRRRLRLANAVVQQRVGRFPPALGLLVSAGFRPSSRDDAVEAPPAGTAPDFLVATPDAATDDVVAAVRSTVAAFAASLGAKVPPPPVAPSPVDAPAFDPWATSVIRMAPAAPEQAASSSAAAPTSSAPSLTPLERRVHTLRAEKLALQTGPPPSRCTSLLAPRTTSSGALVAATRLTDDEAIALGVVAPPSASSSSSSDNDKVLLRRAAARRMRQGQAERDGPFRPRALQELEAEAEALRGGRVWQQAVVRVAMPSGWVAQGRFGPLEDCSAVWRWVADAVLASPLDVSLFTHPPKADLPASGVTVEDAGLVPYGLVRLAWPPSVPSESADGERDPRLATSLPVLGPGETDGAGPIPSAAIEVPDVPGGRADAEAKEKEDRARALAARLSSGGRVGGGSGGRVGGGSGGRVGGGSGGRVGGPSAAEAAIGRVLRLGPRT